MSDLIEKIADILNNTVADSYSWRARFILRAIDEAGYAIVPKEPTEVMIEHTKAKTMLGRMSISEAWEALLHAAPDITGEENTDK